MPATSGVSSVRAAVMSPRATSRLASSTRIAVSAGSASAALASTLRPSSSRPRRSSSVGDAAAARRRSSRTGWPHRSRRARRRPAPAAAADRMSSGIELRRLGQQPQRVGVLALLLQVGGDLLEPLDRRFRIAELDARARAGQPRLEVGAVEIAEPDAHLGFAARVAARPPALGQRHESSRAPRRAVPGARRCCRDATSRALRRA